MTVSEVIDDRITGWLSPAGRFYSCRYGGHYDHAEYICNNIGNYDQIRERKNWSTYDTDLEFFGWRKVQNNTMLNPRRSSIDEGLSISHEQYEWIKNNIIQAQEYKIAAPVFNTEINLGGRNEAEHCGSKKES